MHNEVKYINSQNRTIIFSYKDFYKSGYLIENDTFRDWEHSYDAEFNRITSIRDEIREYAVNVSIAGKNAAEMANELYNIINYDVATKQPGTLYVGDWYLKGYFISSNKTLVAIDGVIRMSLQFVTDMPLWIQRDKHIYRPASDTSGEGHDYPYDYPYSYISKASSKALINKAAIEQDMEIVFYGPYKNPSVNIGGFVYGANMELLEGEYLTINTREKTVIRTNAIGHTKNYFSKRMKTANYPFEKVRPGYNFINTTVPNFDIIVLLERSEPEWI